MLSYFILCVSFIGWQSVNQNYWVCGSDNYLGNAICWFYVGIGYGYWQNGGCSCCGVCVVYYYWDNIGYWHVWMFLHNSVLAIIIAKDYLEPVVKDVISKAC